MVPPPCPCGAATHAGDSSSTPVIASSSRSRKRAMSTRSSGSIGPVASDDMHATGQSRLPPHLSDVDEITAVSQESTQHNDGRRDRLNAPGIISCNSPTKSTASGGTPHSPRSPLSSPRTGSYSSSGGPNIGDYPPTAWGNRMRREEERERKNPRSMRGWRKWLRVVRRHARFVGPGMVSSVAYFDPGNWTVDLSAGASFGYKLLFVILAAGLAAAVLQVLSLRLGIATGTSLSRQIRLLFLRWREKFAEEDAALGVDADSRTGVEAEVDSDRSDVDGTVAREPFRRQNRTWRNKQRDKAVRKCIMAGLYTLWALSEIAIISTDLAELLGSAIAINLLIPEIPLYAGVLITASDVFLVLIFLQNKEGGRKGMLLFELLICSLVLCVFASFIILLIQIRPDWTETFKGYIPSKTLIEPGALYTSIGIIGATIMPHGLYLGSELATIDRLEMAPRPPYQPSRLQVSKVRRFFAERTTVKAFVARFWRRKTVEGTLQTNEEESYGSEIELDEQRNKAKADEGDAEATNDADEDLDEQQELTSDERVAIAENARYEAEMKVFDRIRYVALHIAHATVDTTLSLIGFAITINSSILILASAAFFYGSVSEETRAAAVGADLFSAHDLIKSQLSSAAAFIFALALLCAGQSSSITATLAGQVVSEGFLEWRTSPLVRRMITRMIGIIPSVAVAIAVGRSGISTMLVASQVVLSIVLPTVILPLVYLCSRPDVMTVENGQIPGRPHVDVTTHEGLNSPASMAESTADKRSFVTWWPVTWLGYAIFSVVTVANAYVLLQLFMGNE